MSTPPPSSPQQVIVAPPELPPVPRPVTPHVRRLATREPRTRFWLVLTAVFFASMLYFLTDRIAGWSSERSLVVNGVAAKAKPLEPDGSPLLTRRGWRDVSKFEMPNPADPASTLQLQGFLQENPGRDLISPGETLDIRYSPTNPARWTNRSSPPALVHSLIGATVTLATALCTLAVALLQRARFLKSWVTGELTPAGVVSVTTSPIAPGHSFVYAAPKGTPAQGVYLPRALSIPHKGDVLWLLLPPSGPPVAAQSFL